jgi:hypothetical protein
MFRALDSGTLLVVLDFLTIRCVMALRLTGTVAKDALSLLPGEWGWIVTFPQSEEAICDGIVRFRSLRVIEHFLPSQDLLHMLLGRDDCAKDLLRAAASICLDRRNVSPLTVARLFLRGLLDLMGNEVGSPCRMQPCCRASDLLLLPLLLAGGQRHVLP